MSIEIHKKLAERLTDFIWQSPRNEYDFDSSARICTQHRMLYPIGVKLNFKDDSEDEAFHMLLNELKNDSHFRSSLLSITDDTIVEYKNHYKKYGGKTALFAFCLALSIKESDPENIYKAKLSILNWYFENRRINWTFLNGGHIGAWFPFEWLIENFDSIVASIIGSGIIEIIKSKDWKNTVKYFFQPLSKLKDEFRPYPKSLIKSVGDGNIDEEQFIKGVEGEINENFFYLFQMNKNDIEQVSYDWAYFFFSVINSLNGKEKIFLDNMMDEPKEVYLPDEYKFIDEFREKGFVHLLERDKNSFAVSIYPRDFINEQDK